MPEIDPQIVTLHEWEQYVQSPIYHFMTDLMKRRKVAVVTELLRRETTADMLQVRTLQQEVIDIDTFIELPLHYIDKIREAQKEGASHAKT